MHMKKNVRNSLWIIWLIIGLGIGITIGRLLDWGYFELSKEVSVVDSLNLFITIGLTLYIANILDKRLKQEQFKSDLYVSKIGEIENNLHKIEELLQNSEVLYQQINTIIHIVGIAKNSLIESLSDNDKKSRIIKIGDSLKTKHKELKSLLTDRPIDKQDKSVVVKNNQVTYSSDRTSQIVATIYAIKEEYFELKVLLNE